MQSKIQNPKSKISILLAALLLYVLRFGYDYGLSDQDEFLPYLLHRLDASVLAQDWFVAGQATVFSIRAYFVTMLQVLAQVMPIWLAVLGVYVAVWLATAGAVYALGQHITDNRLAAAGAVVIALVLTPQWTLGGNDLVHSMLVPSMLGWALGLWGLVFFLRRQTVRAALLAGLATWIQALIGLQLAGLLGMILLWRLARGEAPLRPLLVFAGVYGLAALPALGPLVYQQLAGAAPVAAEGTPSLFYILAQFRAPHHYLFFSFPPRSLVRFGMLVVLGVIGFVLLARRRRLHHRVFLIRSMTCIAGLCLVAFVCTEIVPVPFVAFLQFFKTTVLAKLLAVIVICGAAVAWLPDALTRPFERLMDLSAWGLGAVLLLWALMIGSIGLGVDAARAKIGPFVHEGTAIAQVERWAKTETPREAVFAVPPSWSGFRSRAQRAIVVNFKAFPYRDSLNAVWFERLTTLAPITLPDQGSPALSDSLDAAFMRQPAPGLRRLAGQYPFDYVARNRPLPPASPAFETAFTAGDWIVYKIDPITGPAE